MPRWHFEILCLGENTEAGKYALSGKREGRSADRASDQGSLRTSGTPNLALTGSNQAREGRLVDALAARGDEGRDTLR